MSNNIDTDLLSLQEIFKIIVFRFHFIHRIHFGFVCYSKPLKNDQNGTNSEILLLLFFLKSCGGKKLDNNEYVFMSKTRSEQLTKKNETVLDFRDFHRVKSSAKIKTGIQGELRTFFKIFNTIIFTQRNTI